MKFALLRAAATLFLSVGSSEAQESSLLESSASPGDETSDPPGADPFADNIGKAAAAPPPSVSADLFEEIVRRDHHVQEVFVAVWNRMQEDYGGAPMAPPAAAAAATEKLTPAVTPDEEPTGGKDISPKKEEMETKIDHWAGLKERQLLGGEASGDTGLLEEGIEQAKAEALQSIASFYATQKEKPSLFTKFFKKKALKAEPLSSSRHLKEPQATDLMPLIAEADKANAAEAEAKSKIGKEGLSVSSQQLQALETAKAQALSGLQTAAQKNKIKAEAYILVLTEILEQAPTPTAKSDFETQKAKWQQIKEGAEEATLYCRMLGLSRDSAQQTFETGGPGAFSTSSLSPSPSSLSPSSSSLSPSPPAQPPVPLPRTLLPHSRPAVSLVPHPRSSMPPVPLPRSSVPPVPLPRSSLSILSHPRPSVPPVPLPRASVPHPGSPLSPRPSSSFSLSPGDALGLDLDGNRHLVSPTGASSLPSALLAAGLDLYAQTDRAAPQPAPRGQPQNPRVGDIRSTTHPKE